MGRSFNHFGKLADNMPGRAQQLLDAYQGFWVSAAVQLAPVDEGDLAGSGEPAPGDGPNSRRVVFTKDYAMHQEFGTMFMPAQPFLRPARNFLVAAWKRDLARIMKP